MTKGPTVHITMLLEEEARTPEAIQLAKSVAAKLGLEPISDGRATMSFGVSLAKFKQLFGFDPKSTDKQSLSDRDFGRPAGYAAAGSLPIPSELSAYAKQMSIDPPATRFEGSSMSQN